MTITKFKHENNLQEDMKTHPDKKYVIDFFADWCVPCKKLAPTFEALSNDEKYGNLVFLKINVEDEEFSQIVEALQVRSLPTLMVIGYHPEKQIFITFDKMTGNDKDKLKSMLDNVILINKKE